MQTNAAILAGLRKNPHQRMRWRDEIEMKAEREKEQKAGLL
ncbi:MAG TPA: hypothetical protein VFT29_11870 [Gemmatimonadaceae bacterium]|nr:hypothetical protein [Gemmatimonadaceae bacterium]